MAGWSSGRAGGQGQQCLGLFLRLVTCSLWLRTRLVPSHGPQGTRGERATVGVSFWKTPGVTRARGLAPRGVWTLLQGPQSFLESSKQAGSDRLAGKPH